MRISKVRNAAGFNVLSEVSSVLHPRMFDGRPLRSSWCEPEVRVEQLSVRDLDSDFPFLAHGVIAVSDEAMVELRGCMTMDDFEVLPLRCHPNEHGFAYRYNVLNVTNVIDCLNLDRSKLTRTAGGKIIRVDEFVFDSSRLRGISLFKIPQLPYVSIFATEEGVSCFQNAGRAGLEFEQVFSG